MKNNGSTILHVIIIKKYTNTTINMKLYLEREQKVSFRSGPYRVLAYES